ncbi:kiwellin-like [Malania oleifera]|uniref:kiwellin-like n=1 Tax=Malania oleifera TaxID=397392 RepID=UPI0025AE3815|nr:kiwellin-like [Malania oleifera]
MDRLITSTYLTLEITAPAMVVPATAVLEAVVSMSAIFDGSDGLGRGALGPLPGGDDCHPSGNLTCRDEEYPIFKYCSPPVTVCTHAHLINIAFEGGGQGELSSTSCNMKGSLEKVVALLTGWFENMTRCGQMIGIWANEENVTIKVVSVENSTYEFVPYWEK